jgi:hypothetical protein
MDIENAASLRHALLRGVNLFLGAGFSVLAKDADERPMPVGDQLGDELRKEFGASGTVGLNLAQLYTLLARTKKEAVDEYLKRRYTVATFDQRYLSLHRVVATTIFTTNIDSLVHRIYEENPYAYLNDLNVSGPHYAELRAVDLVTLHGSVLDPDRPLRFGTIDIASSFGADPDRWRYLRHRLRQSPTVFWGYSLQDAGALEALRTDGGEALADTWIQIRPQDAESPLVDYFRALDFQIIVSDTAQLLNYMSHNLPHPGDSVPRDRAAAATSTLFPIEAVPLPSAVPNRPIADFFQGAAPGWSDIFSQGLRRVSHFRTIVENVRAPKPTVITGIPGTGKTRAHDFMSDGVMT